MGSWSIPPLERSPHLSSKPMDLVDAKKSLDTVIRKSRDHFYKPIQIAEILYRDRVEKDIDPADLSTYRTQSKAWRDIVSLLLVGNRSTSTAQFQDNVFGANATPPEALVLLAQENHAKDGIVERYIYQCFAQKQSDVLEAVAYCTGSTRDTFELVKFLDVFRSHPSLRTSFDKIFEIVAYVLFDVLITALELTVTVSAETEEPGLLGEFEDFAQAIAAIDQNTRTFSSLAHVYRVGVANAADSGIDMWANFGPIVQVKHLDLTESLAESIVHSVTADRVIIVCKTSQKKVILSLLNQIGWSGRIQSVVTEDDLNEWYNRALRGTFGAVLGDSVLERIRLELEQEYPAVATFDAFVASRGYAELPDDPYWTPF